MKAGETKAAELVTLAVALAGSGATDEQIIAQFSRAESLLLKCRDWLANADQRELDEMLAVAAKADEFLPWSHHALREVAGRSIAYPSKARSSEQHIEFDVAEGKKLLDAVRKGMRRHFSDAVYKEFMGKYRGGIPIGLFRDLWPKLSTWRAGGTTS